MKSSETNDSKAQNQIKGAMQYQFLVFSAMAAQVLAAGRFALVPKKMNNPFFDPARDGCLVAARNLGVECQYIGPNITDNDGQIQYAIIESLLDNDEVDGIAISVKNATLLAPLIDRAVENNVAVVTFDSDAVLSKRQAYVGTDNLFFGRQIALLVKQLIPEGGAYAVVNIAGTPNLKDRYRGFTEEMGRDNPDFWTEAPGSPADFQADKDLALEQMKDFARNKPAAIVSMLGMPMRAEGWDEFAIEVHEDDIMLVSGDAMLTQFLQLTQRSVDGLVGQMPFEMGRLSLQKLYTLANTNEGLSQTIFGTDVLRHSLVQLGAAEIVKADTGDDGVDLTLVFAITGCVLLLLLIIIATGLMMAAKRMTAAQKRAEERSEILMEQASTAQSISAKESKGTRMSKASKKSRARKPDMEAAV